MHWLYLILAGISEIVWAVGLKYTQGFTRLGPSLLTIAVMIFSFWCLARAVRVLPIGSAYAMWTGIGAVGTAIAGIILFQEARDPMRLLCIALIVAGLVGLKWVTPA